VKKIYVGNLSFDTSDHDLNALFAEHGAVSSATIITDRETNRSRGFGFVEMENDAEAMQAIQAINDREIDGRSLNVSEARPREPRRGSRW
jgi:RNA recognition motif-containing protein